MGWIQEYRKSYIYLQKPYFSFNEVFEDKSKIFFILESNPLKGHKDQQNPFINGKVSNIVYILEDALVCRQECLQQQL